MAHVELLRQYAKRRGRFWKASLRAEWEYDTLPAEFSELRFLRNALGCRWLATFRLPEGRP